MKIATRKMIAFLCMVGLANFITCQDPKSITPAFNISGRLSR